MNSGGKLTRLRSWFSIALGFGLSGVLIGCNNEVPRSSQSTRVTSIASPLTMPPGFVEEEIGSNWSSAVGLTFAADGRMFVWEKAGRIWRVENGVKQSPPLLDISDEVRDFRDHGLLGVALHPNFLENGYIYALYAVDHHHLKFAGTANYNPNASAPEMDSIGRLVRYTARKDNGFHSADLASRKVLFGETAGSGCPIVHQSHGVGSLVFGTDGTLLVSCGDGASYLELDTGGAVEGSSNTGVSDGILSRAEDVGSYRSQLLDSLAGKILRLDATTGDGIPSNPFYDANNPRAARSRVWALGLRNPYRMTLRPNTGDHDPAAANPGTLYIGDVGWGDREEINVNRQAGQNFGWPVFEGINKNTGYANAAPANRSAPNPLFGQSCSQQFFKFSDLIAQERTGSVSFKNPCNTSVSIDSVPTFRHALPALEWPRDADQARVPGFDAAGNVIALNVGTSNSGVTGSLPRGSSSIGGVWYTGTDFPLQYRNTYFHGDFAGKWIQNFSFDASDRLVAIRPFSPGGQVEIVALATSPVEGGLFYIDYSSGKSKVKRVRYVDNNNRPPTAVASASHQYGASPLVVAFSARESRDPELGALIYDWDFGDGSPHDSSAEPTHTFEAEGLEPQTFTVTLRVTDPQGAHATTQLVIALNNTPPSVELTSPRDGTLLNTLESSVVPLSANIADAEHTGAELHCSWQVALHHNQHSHPETPLQSCTSEAVLSPLKCGDEIYYYRVALTVSDGAGLSTTETANLYPDCAPIALTPSGVTTNPEPTYSWKASPGADSYELSVTSSSGTALQTATFSAEELGCKSSQLCATSALPALPPGKAVLRVRAHNPVSGFREWSEPLEFEVVVAPDLEPWLKAEYFLGKNFETPIFTKRDPTIAFNWDIGSPHSQVPADGFSVRWSGKLTPRFSEPYTFWTASDDGVRLYIDGELVIDNWTDHGIMNDHATVQLEAGRAHDFQLEYYENGGASFIELRWESPSQASEFIPPSAFSAPALAEAPPIVDVGRSQTVPPSSTVVLDASRTFDPNGDLVQFEWRQVSGPPVTLANANTPIATFVAPPIATVLAFEVVASDGKQQTSPQRVDILCGARNGLRAEYFAGVDFAGTPVVRIDPIIHFNWEDGANATNGLRDNFSVRWSGKITPRFTERYTFDTFSDDGVRVFINGTKIIDGWYDHAAELFYGEIDLRAGVTYDILVEYYERGGSARVDLYWRSLSQRHQPVPESVLSPF